ncbi:hypothetical protein E8E13_007278 [Curvularia kusanoi]|uniref:Uncharacterized protein n=1 Tax=Curvularia kusanoi TaxID=90978 RepID=A0A9P4TGD3_CURKU|nr:hypothetical protein E8E13_007278 [Curvularia kusanoi]
MSTPTKKTVRKTTKKATKKKQDKFITLAEIEEIACEGFLYNFVVLPTIDVEIVKSPKNPARKALRFEDRVNVELSNDGRIGYDNTELSSVKPFCWIESENEAAGLRKKDALLRYYVLVKQDQNGVAHKILRPNKMKEWLALACEDIADAPNPGDLNGSKDNESDWISTQVLQDRLELHEVRIADLLLEKHAFQEKADASKQHFEDLAVDLETLAEKATSASKSAVLELAAGLEALKQKAIKASKGVVQEPQGEEIAADEEKAEKLKKQIAVELQREAKAGKEDVDWFDFYHTSIFEMLSLQAKVIRLEKRNRELKQKLDRSALELDEEFERELESELEKAFEQS